MRTGITRVGNYRLAALIGTMIVLSTGWNSKTASAALFPIARTDPRAADTDGDGYLDGPTAWVDEGDDGLVLRAGEDTNGNGKYDPAGEDGILGTKDDESDPNNKASSPSGPKTLAYDLDRDYLNDVLERRWSTQRPDADADDDGVRDGDEVFIYHTSPAMADTDHDGLSDGYELGLTYSKYPDLRNDYNRSWFSDIRWDTFFVYKLPYESQAYRYYTFMLTTRQPDLSDPNCYDSDFDGVWDLQEYLDETDPMRGLVRIPDADDSLPESELRIAEPNFIHGQVPVNKDYKIPLNGLLNDENEYEWRAPLRIGLGQCIEPITISIAFTPSDTSSPPFLRRNGISGSSFTVVAAVIQGEPVVQTTAGLDLVCPDIQLIDTLSVSLDMGGGELRHYQVGVNNYYLRSDVTEDYF